MPGKGVKLWGRGLGRECDVGGGGGGEGEMLDMVGLLGFVRVESRFVAHRCSRSKLHCSRDRISALRLGTGRGGEG
jgi:hypothetical protein